LVDIETKIFLPLTFVKEVFQSYTFLSQWNTAISPFCWHVVEAINQHGKSPTTQIPDPLNSHFLRLCLFNFSKFSLRFLRACQPAKSGKKRACGYGQIVVR